MTTPQAFVNLHIVRAGRESLEGGLAPMVHRGYGASISVLSEGNQGRLDGQVCASTGVPLQKDGVAMVTNREEPADCWA